MILDYLGGYRVLIGGRQEVCVRERDVSVETSWSDAGPQARERGHP